MSNKNIFCFFWMFFLSISCVEGLEKTSVHGEICTKNFDEFFEKFKTDSEFRSNNTAEKVKIVDVSMEWYSLYKTDPMISVSEKITEYSYQSLNKSILSDLENWMSNRSLAVFKPEKDVETCELITNKRTVIVEIFANDPYRILSFRQSPCWKLDEIKSSFE